jgi:hypothetical protein
MEMSILSRIDRKIAKHGEDFLVNGTTPEKGFFQLLSSGNLRTYLDDTEAMTVVHPTLLLTTTGDAEVDVDDTIQRDGKTYIVRKVVLHRFSGTAMVKVAVLSE